MDRGRCRAVETIKAKLGIRRENSSVRFCYISLALHAKHYGPYAHDLVAPAQQSTDTKAEASARRMWEEMEAMVRVGGRGEREPYRKRCACPAATTGVEDSDRSNGTAAARRTAATRHSAMTRELLNEQREMVEEEQREIETERARDRQDGMKSLEEKQTDCAKADWRHGQVDITSAVASCSRQLVSLSSFPTSYPPLFPFRTT